MSSSHFDNELAKLGETYQTAIAADITPLKRAIAGASEASIIGVGSGGSFTVASLLCNLHEAYTGLVSQALTPLEIICNPTLAAASPVFLVSAEGKNPDITEALSRARMHSSRAVHVLTNRGKSPLMNLVGKLTDIGTHVFELVDKDGYLATNSLLLDCILVARAYEELDRESRQIPDSLNDLRIGEQNISTWLAGAQTFIKSAASRQGLIVTFSPLLRPVAADLESKLSESALLFCQLADLRSFAHGRHLWLAQRPNDCAILALIEPSVRELWNHTRSQLPSAVPTYTMPFHGAAPKDLLAGLVAQMYLVASLAHLKEFDPGRPLVPAFGSSIHYVDLTKLIPPPMASFDHSEYSKYEVLGARWPFIKKRGALHRALESFKNTIQNQTFRAIVFDYDGTLSTSQRSDNPPSQQVVDELLRLLQADVKIGIASGRGRSIQEHLQTLIPEEFWRNIRVGLYNCGYISDLGTMPIQNTETSEFLSHVTRIVVGLRDLGVPIETIRPTHPHQVSVRFREGVQAGGNWFVIADALRQAGLDLSVVVRSKHSVDILGPGVNKSHLVAKMIQEFEIKPYQILTMGDQGAWPGNDAALLEHRFSLSVDQPSRRLDRGWKLAPGHKRDVDATLWYLKNMQILGPGEFKIKLRQIHGAETA